MSGRPRYPRNSNPVDIAQLLPPFAPKDEASQWLFHLQRLGIRPGLRAIRELLAELGDPHLRFPSVVIAGTNGKGTAAIYLDALCRSAGLRTGLYTSPHLLDIRERILIDGQMISSEDLSELVFRHRERIDRLGTTFFESLTALALLHFAQRGVDVAIMETGLGGRLDATNVVRKAAVVLTSVGLDHMELLGSTVEAIAMEKLGLAEPGIPFYLGELDPPIRALALRVLGERGAVPMELGDLIAGESGSPPEAGMLPLVVRGKVQRRQAPRMAACYADLAVRLGWPAANVERALSGLRVHGRYEAYGQDPLLLLDTAHNAQALENVLQQWTQEASPRGRLLIFGLMRDKQIDSAWPVLVQSAGTILLTEPRWYRALPAQALAKRFRQEASRHRASCELVLAGSVRRTLEETRRRAKLLQAEGERCSILVTGSNFLVAEALDRLGIDDLLAPPGSVLWDGGLPLRRREQPRERMTA